MVFGLSKNRFAILGEINTVGIKKLTSPILIFSIFMYFFLKRN